jgi:sialate O-acetylesterase
MESWREAVKAAEAGGKRIPHKPLSSLEAHRRVGNLGALFLGKIAPLIPYGLRGVAWYQGEQNSRPRSARHYGEQLALLVDDWRGRWARPELPFVWVQLPNYCSKTNANWALIREGQRRALGKPNTGMVVTIDIGECDDIHPDNKREVGRRLAAWALGTVYGKDVPTSGPLFEAHEVMGTEVRALFRHADGGLKASGTAPVGFEIAGTDGVWHEAEARIDGDSVVLHSAEVERPVDVRYAWANDPVCNLFNGAGLPASPFTTGQLER